MVCFLLRPSYFGGAAIPRRCGTRSYFLDAALLLRTAAVVGERRHVLDRLDLETGRLEGADRALAAGAGALDLDLDLANAVLLRLVGDFLGGALRGEGSGLAAALVADRAGR